MDTCGIAEILIGSTARLADNQEGEITKIIVDIKLRTVTHLVVCVGHGTGAARLVPIDLTDVRSEEVSLRVTLVEFEQLDNAEATWLITGSDEPSLVDPNSSNVWTDLLVAGGIGLGMPAGYGLQSTTIDKIPPGEVAVRGEGVHTDDGDIGRIRGVLIDRCDYRVTHVLLREGHLWDRKDVAVPMDAVVQLRDGVQLHMTKHQVEGLAAIDINNPTR